MSWNSSAISAVYGGFRPVTPLTFEPSQTFTQALGSIPALNAQLVGQMTREALGEIAATQRNRETIEFNKWSQQAKQRADLAAIAASGLRLAGDALMSSGLNLAGMGLPALQDPRQAQLDQMNYDQQMAGYRRARSQRSNAAATSALSAVS